MARTMAWPIRVTDNGGVALTSADDGGQEALDQLLVLSHLPGPGNSPFDQADDVGAPETVFGAGGTSLTAHAVLHSQRMFRRLELAGRARLFPGYPRADRNGAGETVVVIEYDNLELGQPARTEVK